MIIRLQPQQISALWESIRFGIIQSVAPITQPTPEVLRNILGELLKGDMQCWAAISENKDIYGYVITYIYEDSTKFRTLIIYSLYMYTTMSKDNWDSFYDAVEKFAKINNCKRISAYSNNTVAISIAQKYGFLSDYTYLIKDI